jgi:hypothetical protein
MHDPPREDRYDYADDVIWPMPGERRLVIIASSPSDRHLRIYVPYSLAWVCARAIARDTHHMAVLYGAYGRARFRHDGSGYVEWNSRSSTPGEKTEFDQRTTVVIH